VRYARKEPARQSSWKVLLRRSRKSSLLRPFIVAYKKKYEWDLGGTEDPIYRVKPITVFGFAETPSKAKGNPTRWLFKIP